MEEQNDFFSPKHKQLLSFALWAKYLAWVVLTVYIFSTIGAYYKESAFYVANLSAGTLVSSFTKYLSINKAYALSVVIELLGILLKGVVYFFLLNGLSLGLNMIVETDINYRYMREKKNE